MHIAHVLKEERIKRSHIILSTIKKIFDKDESVRYEMMISNFMFQFGCCRRTVIELMKAALSQVPHEIKTEGKEKIICKT